MGRDNVIDHESCRALFELTFSWLIGMTKRDGSNKAGVTRMRRRHLFRLLSFQRGHFEGLAAAMYGHAVTRELSKAGQAVSHKSCSRG